MNTRRSAFNVLRSLLQMRIPARTEGKPDRGWCVPASGDAGDITRLQVNKAHEITDVLFGGVALLRFYPVGDNELECVLDPDGGYPLGLVDITVTHPLGTQVLPDAYEILSASESFFRITEAGDRRITEAGDSRRIE